MRGAGPLHLDQVAQRGEQREREAEVDGDPADAGIHDIVGLIFGGTLILMIGIWDDVMTLPPRTKLFAQAVVAGISMLYGFIIPGVNNPFHHGTFMPFPLWLSVVVTLVWYLGMMNAINFIPRSRPVRAQHSPRPARPAS